MTRNSQLIEKLINWHKQIHPDYCGSNTPSADSKSQLDDLVFHILKPLEEQFNEVIISYGFNSSELNRYVQRVNPRDTGPREDQHAASELNLAGNRICIRDGAACDLWVKGFEHKMHLVAKFITEHLPFDRLYYYGNDRPIHISFGPEHSRYIQYRRTRTDGKRVLGKVIKLAEASDYFASLD
ncbi:hypothetical protein VIN01S_08590 [Vibrio inusitatus NBRC 102082]|uniref:Peptidase M15A C-terminal domain-containing protein n=1 Tax=Vibrio inusitatus NBRC 102082 TaxID=1219070 RepID=A0A4Y3HSR3_9VIBR|nr:hypothetical protein [Vibrio inusitatus]GEA50055.1 hypothetical protein VIN01S_08590 [Vibrio inusitatus NBRC 102082]